MKRVLFGIIAFAFGTLMVASTAVSQPPGGKGEGGKGGAGGKGGGGMGFKIGTVIPPFMIEQLKLTDDQKTQLAAIEKDLKAKMDKLLTDDQKKILETSGGRGRGPGGDGGPGGKGGPGGDKGGKGGPGGDKGKGPGGERPPTE